VISMPILAMGESSGLMEKGITYIVRPLMHPFESSVRVVLSSSGAIQLLVGPASSCREVLMYVRSSTRATSLGSDLKRKLFGRLATGVAAPLATMSRIKRSYSSLDPSHQWTLSGWHSSVTCCTHLFNPSCLTIYDMRRFLLYPQAVWQDARGPCFTRVHVSRSSPEPHRSTSRHS